MTNLISERQLLKKGGREVRTRRARIKHTLLSVGPINRRHECQKQRRMRSSGDFDQVRLTDSEDHKRDFPYAVVQRRHVIPDKLVRN
jgi:hypothetical protein